ncbi:MAG: CPBP family intramembrane metalloprotease [Candidatus Aminicenantes bacterium]|nr:CPBP family intramembrane metalloprotease [Candidatus Aminicenantes bacterium]
MGALSDNKIYLATAVSAVLFFLVFSGKSFLSLDFWSLFSVTILVLLTAGLKLDPLFGLLVYGDFKERVWTAVGLGLGSAAMLYVIFLAGNHLVHNFWPGSSELLRSVYALKYGTSQWRIGIFLVLIIGPGEELWWRGFLQRHWAVKLGRWPGMLAVAALYAAVHLGSGNLLLVVAALVGGCWWGFQYLKFNSLLSNIISHTVWDLLVFLVFPFY